jgi:hypothetical protein
LAFSNGVFCRLVNDHESLPESDPMETDVGTAGEWNDEPEPNRRRKEVIRIMKKLGSLGAMVFVAALGLAMASPVAAQVSLTTSLSAPLVVYVGDEVFWQITIEVVASADVTGVVVKDGMGADLDEIVLDTPTIGTAVAEKKGKGKMGATMVTWDVGDLAAGEYASLVVTVTTGYNPAGKHEFTSPELGHELDGGASAAYCYEGVDYETPETPPLIVDVLE